MTRKRKKRTPLGPAWLADMTIAFKGWQVALPLAILSWMWRHWRGVSSVLLAGLLFAWTGEPLLAGLGLFVVYGLAKWRPAKRKARWWDEETLSRALVDAGTLKMNGEKLPTLSYKGKPQHGEYGTTVIVGLPQAKGPEDVTSRLAKALQIPAARLSVTQEPTDNANVVRIHVGATPKKSPPPPPVASMERTDWRDPIAIGRTDRGAEETAQTRARNTMSGGKPGMGKTSFGHMVMAHYLLDPSTSIHVLDGKGSHDDYAACAPLLDTYIRLQRVDVVDALIRLLREVGEEVDRRNGAGDNDTHPGMLLVLEELQNVRSRASIDKAKLEEIDRLLGEIIRLARAVNVHILTLVQKPSANDIPTGFRSQFTQGLAFKMHKADYPMVLDGAQPEVALPTKEGEAIWCADGEQERILCYYLTDADWRKVCGRAAALRTSSTRPQLAAVPPLPVGSPVGEGLVDEVVAILSDEGPMSTTDLHTRLSAAARDSVGSEVRLGLALKRFSPRVLRRARAGNGSVWCLAEDPDRSARGVDA